MATRQKNNRGPFDVITRSRVSFVLSIAEEGTRAPKISFSVYAYNEVETRVSTVRRTGLHRVLRDV